MREYEEKEIKIGKKTKMKSLKQVIDICLKDKRSFEVCDRGITILTDDCNDEFFRFEEFGKSYTVAYATLDFDLDGDVCSEVYYLKNGGNFPIEFSKFFTKFPKLPKSSKKPNPLPPEPDALATLPKGEGLEYNDIKHLDDNTVVAGCQVLNMKQVENIFKFFGGVLGYDVED